MYVIKGSQPTAIDSLQRGFLAITLFFSSTSIQLYIPDGNNFRPAGKNKPVTFLYFKIHETRTTRPIPAYNAHGSHPAGLRDAY